jgi:hypothetical protein
MLDPSSSPSANIAVRNCLSTDVTGERIHFCRVFRPNLWTTGPATIAVGALFSVFISRPLDY